MSLRKQIISLLDESKEQMTMQELYAQFPDIAKTTVRGRIYDALGDGIHKLGKGLYISQKAIVEQGNALEIIDRLVAEKEQFEFIFLDIPYEAAGQKGGNRDLSTFTTINPDEFGIFMKKCVQLLKTDNSPLMFMFTSGRSSKPMHDKYFNKVLEANLKQCRIIGGYEKLWSNGNPMNMGKYKMPTENLYLFSRSGELDINITELKLNFSLTPNLRLYPTAKPYPMIHSIVKQLTNTGDWVADFFAGSGVVLKACIELGRKCYAIDRSEVSVEQHLLPLL